MAKSRLLFRPKEPALARKEPALARKGAGLRRLSRLLLSVGRHGKKPAEAGVSRLLLPAKSRLLLARKSRLLLAKSRLLFWPALAGFGRKRGRHGRSRLKPARVRHLTARQARCSAPERCCFWAASRRARRVLRKTLLPRPKETGERRKPLFSVFSGVGKGRFSALFFVPAESDEWGRLNPAKRACPLRWAFFLTGKEGS